MSRTEQSALVRLDFNNPVFQENLLTLQKPERHAAIDTLNKLRQVTWNRVYRDNGLKWEKIVSVKPPHGIDLFVTHHTSTAGNGLSRWRFYPAVDYRV